MLYKIDHGKHSHQTNYPFQPVTVQSFDWAVICNITSITIHNTYKEVSLDGSHLHSSVATYIHTYSYL